MVMILPRMTFLWFWISLMLALVHLSPSFYCPWNSIFDPQQADCPK
jgi:hypothetical protein